MLGDFPKLGHQKPSTMAPSYRVADRARGARPQSRMSSRTWFPALRRGRLPLCAPHWTWAPRPRAQAELGLSPTRPTLGAHTADEHREAGTEVSDSPLGGGGLLPLRPGVIALCTNEE